MHLQGGCVRNSEDPWLWWPSRIFLFIPGSYRVPLWDLWHGQHGLHREGPGAILLFLQSEWKQPMRCRQQFGFKSPLLKKGTSWAWGEDTRQGYLETAKIKTKIFKAKMESWVNFFSGLPYLTHQFPWNHLHRSIGCCFRFLCPCLLFSITPSFFILLYFHCLIPLAQSTLPVLSKSYQVPRLYYPLLSFPPQNALILKSLVALIVLQPASAPSLSVGWTVNLSQLRSWLFSGKIFHIVITLSR